MFVANDPADSELVAFAGTTTWTFDGNAWTAHPNTLPADPYAGLHYPVMATDPTGHAILFGGSTYDSNGHETDHKETLRWNGGGWDALAPATSPPGRQITEMTYDPATQTTVLFGGYACTGSSATGGCTTYLGDTWTWDGSTWTQQTQSGPVNRAFAAMAYASSTGQVVLCCGIGQDSTSGYAVENDTWTWDGKAWTQQSPSVSPRPILDFGFASFLPSGQAIVFGGQFNNPGRAISDQVAWGPAGGGGQVPE